MKPSNWLENFNCAIEGILWAAKTQRHMRCHLLAGVLVLLFAHFMRLSALEFILLAFAVTLVIFAELINTAVEVVVDLVSPEYHPLAKRAKDVAAGAVLVASIGAVVMGYFALSRYIMPALGLQLDQLGLPPGEFPVVSILVVIMLVVLLKARVGKGAPLHGGMPSGHSAVSFSIAMAVVLSGAGAVLSVLALILAGMVSHSRLLLGIHSLKEIIAGALLGTLVTVLIYFYM
ncbi:diacylglycerol kinase [Trichloromonas sp.]|uniref:diacylglycerol kinase n=1 Tax=Trichloromonas sp. TaxID=3069249 RepID=UPI003D813333